MAHWRGCSAVSFIGFGHWRKQVLILGLSSVLVVAAHASAFALRYSPTSLAFVSTQGSANPPAQTLTIWKRGSREKNWSAVSPVAWLSPSPVSGSISSEQDTIQVAVNASGLAAGSYTSSLMITVVNLNGTIRKTAVPVTLTVNPAPPVIGLSPTALSFSGTAGGSNPPVQTLSLSNTGGGTLSWTASNNAAWLSLSPASGTNSGMVHASVNLAGLAAGTYTAAITITATGATTKTVPVTLTVGAATVAPVIALSPTSLAFSGTAGGTNPAAKSFTVSNSGGGTLSWTASDNAAWLTLSPASGTNSGTVHASVNLTGLAAGTYNGTITVSAPGATSKTLPVSLTVSTAPAASTIGFSPTSLAFSGAAGGTNPAGKSFTITNPGSGTLSWTISDNAAWLSVTPTSGTTTTETDTLTATVNISGLAAGTYNGTITITASGATNSPRTIPVSLTLSGATAGTATLSWNANTESDLAGYKIYRATASGAYGAPVATLSSTATSYVATGLQTGTTYFFVITAYDSAGNESTYSNEVSKSVF